MKICPMGAEVFHVDRRTYRHDEANSRFSQFCERAQKSSLNVKMQLSTAYVLDLPLYNNNNNNNNNMTGRLSP